MSAIATSFLTGSTIRANTCAHPYPCRRRLPPSLPTSKVLCADKVCAAEFDVTSLTSARLQTDRLCVDGELRTDRLVVGSTSDCTFSTQSEDETLIVNGNVVVCGPCASLTLNGDLVMSSKSFEEPARISASRDCRSAPLILDVAYDDLTSECMRLSDFPPHAYAARGLGYTAEIKKVKELLCRQTPDDVLGWLETRVLPECNHKQVVIQTLSTSPAEHWSMSGLFQRCGIVGHKWNEWREITATICPN